MALGPSLLVAALAAPLQSPAADSLRLLAVRLPESALALEARARPLAVREAVSQALARSELAAAGSLAAAYAVAWSDSFLVREVARFAAWPPERRAAKGVPGMGTPAGSRLSVRPIAGGRTTTASSEAAIP